jgi:predicted anti-sigma-YlaC factor YlaD
LSARVIAAAVGLFYLGTGLWAFFDPASFAGSVATFAPFNRHLLHDAGAFSTGLGVVLLISAWRPSGLVEALLAVLAASLLHLWAHIEDINLGGRPGSDIPILALVCVALGAGVVAASRSSSRAVGRS